MRFLPPLFLFLGLAFAQNNTTASDTTTTTPSNVTAPAPPSTTTAAPSGSGAKITFNPIDPNSVAIGSRNQWCVIHRSTCTNICYDQKSAVNANKCDPKTLTNACVCKNGFIPDPNQYTNTVPYFMCIYSLDRCQQGCNSVESCVLGCRASHICTAQDPPKSNSTTTPTDGKNSTSTNDNNNNEGNTLDSSSPAHVVSLGSLMAALVVQLV